MIKYRTVFISDVHLGTKMSQADKLLEFIKTFECDKLVLIGDIIDGWALYKSFYWPQIHNDVIQKIMRMARKGTEIIYVPGNHDEFLRSFGEHEFGNIKLINEFIHVSADNKNYLITHGDKFDVVIEHAKWLSHFGSWAYDVSIFVNVIFNKVIKLLNLEPISISSWLKYKVKKAVNFIGNYENTLSDYAKSVGCSGIICGHIHHPNKRDIMDVTYLNCGDWVETCSAVVEHQDGTMEVIMWK